MRLKDHILHKRPFESAPKTVIDTLNHPNGVYEGETISSVVAQGKGIKRYTVRAGKFMKGRSEIIKAMAMVHFHGHLALSILAIGKMVKLMVKVLTSLLMVPHTRVI